MEKLNLEEIFSQMDRQKFLYRFECLCKHLNTCLDDFDSYCHDINQIVNKITDQLLNNVSIKDFKYEQLLLIIPWQKYLYLNHTSLYLKSEILNRFLREYIQIFPNRCEKFLDNFLFILRGDSSKCDETEINQREMLLFSSIRNSIKLLIENVNNFESIFVRLVKKRYPYFHNSNMHEFICYAYNIIYCADLISYDNALDLFDFLFTKLLEIDLEQFFNELSYLNKENKENVFDMDLEIYVTTPEQYKKAKILESILVLLFEYIDDRLKKQHDHNELSAEHHWDKMIEAITRIFFQRILPSDSLHCQYVIFYICSQSRSYCDILTNDLWTLAISTQIPILVRESSFNVLVSLFLNANFQSINNIFSFLKIILQWLNSFLLDKSSKTSPESLNENDLMYYNICIGFCQLFCVFHNDMFRNQIDCLKNMDMKRVILNSNYKPLQYLCGELRDHFIHLSSYYRIGYSSLTDIHNRTLNQTFPNHQQKTCHFGRIHLKCIQTRIEPFVYDLKMLSNRINENIGFRIQDELISEQGKIRSSRKTLMATSPNFTSTSEDALTDGANMTSFIINHMLSDYE